MELPGPTVVRRQLGRRLRRLHEASGLTERDIQEATGISRSKLWHLWNGLRPVKIPDVWALCRLYGADASTTEALAALAGGTAGRGWWEAYSDVVPAWFGLYVGLEADADDIRTYEAELIHGLLQTPDYARQVYRAAQPGADPAAVDRHIDLRLARQRRVLGRTRPPRLTAILSSGVLARCVGGPAVMAAQVGHLRELARLDHIDVRVLDWAAGAHPAMLGAFTLLDFDDPDDPALVYIESQVGAHYLEEQSQVEEYRRVFELTAKQTISIEEYV